eukprot:gene12262-14372_t
MVLSCTSWGIQIHSANNAFKKPIYSAYMKGFKPESAYFLPGTDDAIMMGGKEFYYTFNLTSQALKKHSLRYGKNLLKQIAISKEHYTVTDSIGKLSILSNKSKALVKEVQLASANISSMRFSGDGMMLYIAADGYITCYSLKTMSVANRFKDHGNSTTKSITSIALSPNGNYISTGSESGIINIYDQEEVLTKSNPTPLKTFDSFVHPITSLEYDYTSRFLIALSKHDNGLCRMFHHPSFKTVHLTANVQLPTMSRLSTVSFVQSPKDQRLYLGNDRGELIVCKGIPNKV